MRIKRAGIALICCLSILAGCDSNSKAYIYNDDSKIASEDNTYNLDNYEQKIEGQNFHAQAGRMEGMDTIWTYNPKEDEELDLTYTIKVHKGKMKLVQITPDSKVEMIVEIDSEMDEPTNSKLPVKSGKNSIKIVADKDTKFDIDLSVSAGKFHKLGFN